MLCSNASFYTLSAISLLEPCKLDIILGHFCTKVYCVLLLFQSQIPISYNNWYIMWKVWRLGFSHVKQGDMKKKFTITKLSISLIKYLCRFPSYDFICVWSFHFGTVQGFVTWLWAEMTHYVDFLSGCLLIKDRNIKTGTAKKMQ